jgi:hypothetical protein
LAIGRQPFIPLLQHFQRAVNHFVGALICSGALRFRNAVFLFGL